MKRVIILILTLILFSSIVAAVNVEINAIQNHVLKDQNATFEVTIENDAFEDKLFTIKSIDLNYILQESPFVEHLGKNSKATYQLNFVPLKDLTPKVYGISLIIISDKGDRVERYILINLLKNEDVLDTSISGGINPRKTSTISFDVKNKYEIPFDNLNAKLTASFLDKEFSFPLDKKGEHIEDIVLNLDPNLKSGIYPVRVLIKYGSVVLTDKDININVGSFSNLKEISNTEKGILIKREVIRKINEGNAVIEEQYKRDFSLSEKIFTWMTPGPDQVQKIGNYYTLTWNLRVEPGQEIDIILYKDYRNPLLVLILCILIGYFIYRFKVKSIRIKKKVMTLHTSEKDFILGMKVLLNVKNRGSKLIKKIIVREKIPSLGREPKDFGLHKPTLIERSGNDFILTWEIPHLKSGEEKTLTYRAESKLHVVGKLMLPPASVKFEDKNRKQIAYSNRVTINMKKQ